MRRNGAVDRIDTGSTSPVRGHSSLMGVVTSLSGAALVAAAVAFLSNILAARTLGPELRGHVAFVLQLSYFIAPVLVLASDRALLRASHEEGNDRFFHAGRGTLLIMTVLATAVAVLLFQDWRWLCGPVAATTGWFLLRRAHVVGVGRYHRYLVPFLAYQALILVSHVVLAALEVTSWPAWAAAYAIPAVVLLLIRATPSSSSAAGPTRNVPLVVAALTQMWSLRGERILLPLLAGPSQLGLYVVIATATEPLYWVAQAGADHSVTRGGTTSVRSRLRALLRLLAIFAIAATALGVALWLLVMPVFGGDFEPARQFVLPLVIAAVLLAGYRQTSAWVLAGDRPERLGRLEAIVAGFAVVAYPVGIVMGAGLGAAWASAAVYLVAVVIGQHPSFYRTSSTEMP